MSLDFAIAAKVQAVREHLRLGDEPVPDIIKALEQYGLTVFVQGLGGHGPDGAFVPRRHIKFVLLNCDKTAARVRFTGAHELGHAAFNDGATVDRDLDPVQQADRPEVRANRFAASFLVPERGLAAALGTNREKPDAKKVLELAREFGVSYRMMLFRLQNLRILTPGEREQLLGEQVPFVAHRFSSRISPRFPPEYIERSLRAYAETRITFERLAELLDKSPTELEKDLTGFAGPDL